MTSFKQFLCEDQTEYDEQIVEQVSRTLLQECGPYLKELNYDIVSNKVFTGVPKEQPSDDILIRKQIRTREQPRDSENEIHQAVGAMFEHVFGLDFRKHSYFGTGSYSMAALYGDVHVSFPIGRYRYLWSPKIHDLFVDTSDWDELTLSNILFGEKLSNRFNDMIASHQNDPQSQKTQALYQEVARRVKYNTNNLLKAIKSGNEIMISCRSYYIMPNNIVKYSGMFDEIATRIKNQDPIGQTRKHVFTTSTSAMRSNK